MVPTRSERAGKERAKTAPQRMETENEFLFTREKYAKQNILGGGIPTPLKNVSSSVGMMTFCSGQRRVETAGLTPKSTN